MLKIDYISRDLPHIQLRRLLYYADLLTWTSFCFSAIYASNYEEPHFNNETQFSDNDPQADHTYAPLNFPDSQNINGQRNVKEQLHRTLENPSYGKDVKSQVYVRAIRPISMEQPVYNLIEEFSMPAGEDGPEQDGVTDQDEEPYLEPIDSDGTVHYNPSSPEEPFYNTLEELYNETL